MQKLIANLKKWWRKIVKDFNDSTMQDYRF
jgi:hypothetical protein